MNNKHDDLQSAIASHHDLFFSRRSKPLYRLSNVAKILNDTMKDNFEAEYNRYFSRQPMRWVRYDMGQRAGVLKAWRGNPTPPRYTPGRCSSNLPASCTDCGVNQRQEATESTTNRLSCILCRQC